MTDNVQIERRLRDQMCQNLTPHMYISLNHKPISKCTCLISVHIDLPKRQLILNIADKITKTNLTKLIQAAQNKLSDALLANKGTNKTQYTKHTAGRTFCRGINTAIFCRKEIYLHLLQGWVRGKGQTMKSWAKIIDIFLITFIIRRNLL